MNSKERKERRYQRRREKRKKPTPTFDEVFTYEHLYESYRQCRKNVGWKASTQKFVAQAPLEVYRIWKKLNDGTWKSKGFYEFDILERGKIRHIKSVTIEERIVQKCLCDYALTPVLTRTFIYDNGATVPGKGYHFSMNRIEKHLHDHYRKYGTEGYILVYDFSKYFDSISHSVIKNIVRQYFDDPKLIGLIDYLVDCFGDRGLGLGSQISQIFALACANRLDHYCKEVLRIHGYGRYMDDGYLIHHDKEYLKKCLSDIQRICDELGITLNRKKTQIIKLSHGFTFLKCRYYLTDSGKVVRKIYKKSVTRMRRKLKKFDGKLPPLDVYQSYQSWRAYACHFDAWYTVQNMDKLYSSLFCSLSGVPDEGLFYLEEECQNRANYSISF